MPIVALFKAWTSSLTGITGNTLANINELRARIEAIEKRVDKMTPPPQDM